jgi:hypothetical protein
MQHIKFLTVCSSACQLNTKFLVFSRQATRYERTDFKFKFQDPKQQSEGHFSKKYSSVIGDHPFPVSGFLSMSMQLYNKIVITGNDYSFTNNNEQ